jgi:Flp pilus assembly protein TadG
MANKKITELPYITGISGSTIPDNPILNTVLPVVLYGTTNQITIENFSKFVTQYSAHTGSAGNIFTGPQTINNNVTINGTLRVTEVVAQYETASILFSTGSTKLGDQITDKHEFTGSTNITGSIYCKWS